MKLDTYEDVIAKAKSALQIADSDFTQLPHDEAELAVNRIEDRFVDGHNWRRWWWEHFSQTEFAVQHSEDAATRWLHRILPELEAKVWFVVEPFGEKSNSRFMKQLLNI